MLASRCARRLSRRAVYPVRASWTIDRMLAAAPDRPTLLLMHDPPFVTGVGRMGQYGLSGRAAFAEVILRHPQIL